jgi:hypothetical protein
LDLLVNPMAKAGLFSKVALVLCSCAASAMAHPLTVEIIAPGEYAPPVPRVEVRFRFDEGGLRYEAVSVEVDGAGVQFDAVHDGRDNDGDGLVDEQGETVWSELSSTSALMRAWMPYRLQVDDPGTLGNEGRHTIRVTALGTQGEWGEAESAFHVTEELSPLQAHCYPNPFSPEETGTQLTFVLSSSATVTAQVYDFEGKKIATIFEDQWREAGCHRDACDRWWGRDRRTGRRVSAGVYFVRVQAEREGQKQTDVVKIGVLPKP